MTEANDVAFLRVGCVFLNLRSIAYAWIDDDCLVIQLDALDGQGKPKRVTVPNPESEQVAQFLMARTVLDVRPPEG